MSNPFLHTSSSGSSHGGSGGSFGGNSAGAPPTNNATTRYLNNLNSAKSVSSGGGTWSVGSSSGLGSNYADLLRSISDANNAFNIAQVNAVNEFNSREAQKNRDWQERMARNAHQYEVEDLIKAGLNPVLSAGGQGAVVGSGAVASGQKAVADSIYGNGVMSLMSSMISAASAQSVAGIYAAAQMRGQDISRQNQLDYLGVLRENNTANNLTGISKTVLQWLPSIIRAAG